MVLLRILIVTLLFSGNLYCNLYLTIFGDGKRVKKAEIEYVRRAVAASVSVDSLDRELKRSPKREIKGTIGIDFPTSIYYGTFGSLREAPLHVTDFPLGLPLPYHVKMAEALEGVRPPPTFCFGGREFIKTISFRWMNDKGEEYSTTIRLSRDGAFSFNDDRTAILLFPALVGGSLVIDVFKLVGDSDLSGFRLDMEPVNDGEEG